MSPRRWAIPAAVSLENAFQASRYRRNRGLALLLVRQAAGASGKRGSSLESAVTERTADFDLLAYDSFDPATRPLVELLT
jgi:hypothetical protein